MNNNVERIRDTLAGAILGAVIAVVIFLISLILSAINFAGSAIKGDGTFEAMSGGKFVALIIILMLIGGAIGYALGYHSTKPDVVRNNIVKWLKKHNKA